MQAEKSRLQQSKSAHGTDSGGVDGGCLGCLVLLSNFGWTMVRAIADLLITLWRVISGR
jgi:hypothetical protein